MSRLGGRPAWGIRVSLFTLAGVFALGVFPAWSLPEAADSAAPLFAESTPLKISLRGPFETIDDERDKSQNYEGVLNYEGKALDVTYQVRGNFRLRRKTCRHAPLWLDFKKKQVKDTVFDGQNKLKLVVQCRDAKVFKEYLALEEQLYRMFGLLSPVALHTRQVEVEYVDANSGERRNHIGFLVEHHKNLAKRFDLEVEKDRTVSKVSLDAEQSSLVALFNFVIANTDYSMLGSPGEDSCCHNTKALRDSAGVVYPLPYDFDQTGYVSPTYAQVSEGIGQKNIRHRIYRGFCVDGSIFRSNVEKILNNREKLMAIASETSWVGSRRSKRAQKFLVRGLDVLANAKKLNREVATRCR